MQRSIALCLTALSAVALLRAGDALSGAGATFPSPLYQKWFDTYHKKSPAVSIAYQAIGSGKGIEALAAREVDFAASDYPLGDERLARLGRAIRQIPTVVGGLVPAYRLEGVVEDLRFTPETLAAIYLGKIRRWNDPALRAVNPGVRLPARDIVVLHRSDSSGSTYIWTEYLSKVSEQWKSSVGKGDTVAWPVGVGAERNEGLATVITNTPDSIGYVEFIYAVSHKLDFGAVRNRAGRFVEANLATLQAAAHAVESLEPGGTAPGPGSYPIASMTFLLIPEDWQDLAKRSAMLDFLSWMLTTGQKQAGSLGYVALPARVSEHARKLVEELRSGAAYR